MRLFIALALASWAAAAYADCQPAGWVLVQDKVISATERQCTWEKNGAKVSKIVGSFCPLDPC